MPSQEELKNFMDSVRTLESRGNPDAVNDETGAHGYFQIMPDNWEPWSKEAFGAVKPRTPENQERVAAHKMMDYYNQFGDWESVATAWFAGPQRAQKLKEGDSSILQYDDGSTTVREYIDTVMSGMEDRNNHQSQISDENLVADFEKQRQERNQNRDPVQQAQEQNPFSTSASLTRARGTDMENMWQRALQNVSDLTAGRQRPTAATIEAESASQLEPIEPQGDVGVENAIQRISQNFGRPPKDVQKDYDLTNLSADELPDINTPSPRPHDQVPDLSDEQSLGQNAGLAEQREDVGDVPAADQRQLGSSAFESRGKQVVQTAQKYLGVPYKWGGTNPQKGLDCSGLLQLVFKQHGVDLPRVSRQQAKEGREVPSIDQAQPGDLVAFSSRGYNVGHIGMYIGNGEMLHAPRSGTNVRIDGISEYYGENNWQNKLTTIRRVLPDESEARAGGQDRAA